MNDAAGEAKGSRDSEEREVVVKETRAGTRDLNKRLLVVEPSAENVLEMDEYSVC